MSGIEENEALTQGPFPMVEAPEVEQK